MKTRAAFLALVVVVVACGVRVADPFRPAARNCAQVVVENRNFADVTVRVGTGNRRLGVVDGITTRTFDVCDPSVRPVFSVDAIGDAFTITLTGASQFLIPGQSVRVIIGPDPRARLSFVVGQT